jgi:hypothetical protein
MAVHWSSSKKPFEFSIPPQGKRKKSIKIMLTFAEPDKERDEVLDKQIFKIVFKR